MKVSCQACGAKYTIADDKVRGRKVKIRCKSCGTPIVVDGQSDVPAVAAAGSAPATAAAPAAATGPSVSWSVNLSDTDQRTMTTEEIVAAWKSGEVTSDAFVWKDGMGDWVAVLEHAELAPLLSGAAAGAPTPGAGTPFGPTVVTATAPAESARLSGGGRGAGVDLFNASAAAGAPEEDDVATSAPALPTAGSTAYDDGKMTGARNENSVLFSLDSLKSGLTAEKKPPAAKKPSMSAAASSDPFAMSPADVGGGNALFSLNTNQALLTAPAAPEPPPPRLDASGAPAAPMNKTLVYGGGGAIAVLLLVIGLLLGRSGNKEEGAAPDGSAKVATSDSAEPEKKSDSKEKEAKEEKKEEEKPAESAAASASAAPSAVPTGTTKVASGTSGEHKATSTTPSTPKEPKAAAAPQPKAEEMPSQGSSPFSVSAAQVALTQAAANAMSCSKPGGPTGSGKVQVTFATSGRVTTANVAGPPFAGTPVGGCVAGVFRKARIPAFAGNTVTVSKSFNIH
jgi:predicted Zn finger-like uncharacterized protein